MSKRTDRIFTDMCSSVKLTAKEKRLYKYLLDHAASNKDDKRLTIADACKDLRMIGKTCLKSFVGLKEKGLVP